MTQAARSALTPSAAAFVLWVLLTTTTAAQEVLSPEQRALYERWMQFGTLVKNWRFDPTWSADGKHLWYFTGLSRPSRDSEAPPETPEIQVFDLETNEIRPLVDVATVRSLLAFVLSHEPAGAGLPFQSFEFTDTTLTQIRFWVEGRKFELDISSYDLAEVPEATRLVTEPQVTRRSDVPGYPEDLAEVRSPDGRWFTHLKDHNVWLRSADDGRLVQLTFDGVADYEWAADWPDGDGHWAWWSPDGKRLAVQKVDNRRVLKLPVLDSETQGNVLWARYPIIGGERPQPELWVLDPATLEHTRIDIGPEPGQELGSVVWRADGTELLYVRLNRRYTRQELLAADPVTGASRLVLSESQDYLRSGQAMGPRTLRFLSDGRRLLRVCDQDGWFHLCLYDMRGQIIRRLTEGNWEVHEIVAVVESSGWVYFQGSDDRTRPYDVHLYRVGLDGRGFQRLTEAPGMHRTHVAPSGEYFVDYHSDLARPWRLDLRREDGTYIRNLAVADTSGLSELGWSAPEEFTVKADDGVTDLYGILWKPADFDPTRAYPVIQYIFGGESDRLAVQFTISSYHDWAQAMAQLGFITMYVASRGTAGRGRDFAAWKFANTGRYEIPDHVAALRQLAAERPYMDMNRVGIFGYSWGGHFAMRALLQAPDVYHVGVSGAPDIDLRWYDFGGDGKPEYRGDLEYGSNLWLADRLQGKLLIYQSTKDFLVPLMEMIDEFVLHGKRFDLMLFPGKTRSQLFVDREYVFPMVRDYFVEHLRPAYRDVR